MSGEPVSLTVESDGVATLLWEPQGPMNVFSEAALASFDAAVGRIASDPVIVGAIVASSGRAFHAGADLDFVMELFDRSPQQVWAFLEAVMTSFRRLETCGKPVVAAINGHALGGGFEMALACHGRVVADDPAIRLGLPESAIGLMPGFGGTQRLPRLIEYRSAVRDMVKGRTWSPRDALALGAVDEVVAPDALRETARKRVLERLGNKTGATQPWDRRGTISPAADPGFAGFFTEFNAAQTRANWGNRPAERLVAEAVYHGLQMPIDPALRLEARRFVELSRIPATRAVLRTSFFAVKDARALRRRPVTPPVVIFRKIGVIGGGLMGGGIAYQAAKAGLSVVLIEIDAAAAARGVGYSERLLDRAVDQGSATEADRADHLARITPTTDYAALADCDLVIEAVHENADLKHRILAQAEAVMRPDAILASNTSTIPIGQLARPLRRKDRLLGLHFFSPVERMALLEIIDGPETSETTLAAGFDLAKVLGKTPVAVNDGRGFFTSRVVVGYILEGMALLGEGVAAPLVESAGRRAGMPMGPLRLGDMIGLDIIEQIEAQTEADLGAACLPNPGRKVGQTLIGHDRPGEKRRGAGFYDHADDGPRLWHGLADLFPPASKQPDIDAVAERLMFRQAVETLCCFDDGVLASAADADVASVLGWGFAPHTGGVASYIDQIGSQRLLDYCRAAEMTIGPRFAVPKKLEELARSGIPLRR
ncbi:3-hydroxyacyl-CoA dehydrogenase/enoyl-CoA hydratase/3-hydroxybutyryl-CoA epimerase [Amaricoccus macauensis]|uniref:3-hydroxyacyl-CoA dehydrogenase/enoyl-CoA hydratase/3-hydroxybutyryl-CoA epimerase n=1 Tax=Amaricoccus macauensis TaxID=57001 RepID=A0A840STD9_9RHOB|nr:3-hydroxyacyl-CoA dehydrogenase NAD-binding domain-containing protein [Amaricoccus macauensis]MBB5223096.1 3-hydroxyacyl-CoA dehydrogenase/enoyl-CoA hydratase/3-hydroxybutyryl-CoA epimerase [Amaricoccus macauensis]